MGHATLRRADGTPLVSACFAPGTSQEVIDATMRRLERNMLERVGPKYFLGSGRWSAAVNTPATVRWSFVPDGIQIETGKNSTLFASMDAKFGGNRTLWMQRVTDVFSRWNQLAGLSFQRITVGGNPWDDGATWGTSGANDARGDIRISSINIDGGGSVLAYNYYPGGGLGGDMVIDSSENWGSSGNLHRFFRNTLAHENGHGIGIAHVCPAVGTKLLEPFLNTSFDGPQHDDVRAAHENYGDKFEPNNTQATASNLGSIAQGASAPDISAAPAPLTGTGDPNISLLSIGRDGDQDFYRFTVAGPARINVSVVPVGLSYDSRSQTSGCPGGNVIDSRNVADLAFQVIDNNANVIATVNAQGLGGTESTTNLPLPTAGTYFVRVFENDAPVDSQLYRLNLSVNNPNITTPVAVNDNYAVAEGGTLNVNAPGVLANDVDPDPGANLSAILVDSPTKGTLLLNANGGFDYFANVGASGTDTFTYRVDDGLFLSNIATVTITISTTTKTFTGTVNLGDYTASPVGRVVTFEVRSPGTTTVLFTQQVGLGSGGSFSFNAVLPAGNYDVSAKASHWLRDVLPNVSVGLGGASSLTFSLINGDVNGDNRVNVTDRSLMNLAFGSRPGDSNWNPEADLNGDDRVNVTDRSIMNLRFGARGED